MIEAMRSSLDSKLKVYFFLIVFIIISLLFFKMFASMWQLVVLAFLAALLFYPFYNWLSRKTKFSVGIKTAISLLFLYAVIIIPSFFVLGTLLEEIIKVGVFFSNTENVTNFINSINDFLQKTFNFTFNLSVEDIDKYVEENVQGVVDFFASSLVNIAGISFTVFTQTVFFTIFFLSLLPNLSKLKKYFLQVSPLGAKINILYLDNVK